MAPKAQRKIVISAAVTGGVHTPTMSKYLPKTPDQIIEDAVNAAKAGAGIVHIHARREDGSPTADLIPLSISCPISRSSPTSLSASPPAALRA